MIMITLARDVQLSSAAPRRNSIMTTLRWLGVTLLLVHVIFAFQSDEEMRLDTVDNAALNQPERECRRSLIKCVAKASELRGKILTMQNQLVTAKMEYTEDLNLEQRIEAAIKSMVYQLENPGQAIPNFQPTIIEFKPPEMTKPPNEPVVTSKCSGSGNDLARCNRNLRILRNQINALKNKLTIVGNQMSQLKERINERRGVSHQLAPQLNELRLRMYRARQRAKEARVDNNVLSSHQYH